MVSILDPTVVAKEQPLAVGFDARQTLLLPETQLLAVKVRHGAWLMHVFTPTKSGEMSSQNKQKQKIHKEKHITKHAL